MAKSRAQKESLLEVYKTLLSEKKGFFALDTLGMDADTLMQLKKKLRAEGTNLSIIKNRVFKIALNDAKYPVESSDFTNQTAIIAYNEDPTVVAKMIKAVQKDSEKFEARFGVVEGAFLTGSKAMEIADLPSKEVLLSRLLGSMNAPLTGFARVITGNVSGFVRVVKQISEK